MEKFFISRNRLDWCRKNYHIELDELAVRAGIKPALLRRAYKGEMVLTAEQLWDLGEALDLAMSFFMKERDVSKTETRLPHFRAAACRPRPSTQLLMIVGRVERHRDHFDAVLDESPRRNARKVAYPSLRPDASWVRKAQRVRKWLGISGGEGFAELRARIEQKDIMVFVSNSYRQWDIPVSARAEERFKGFALRHELLPAIFLVREQDERALSFTLMHELAHLILHKGDALDGEQSLDPLRRDNRQEIEANALAGCVLLSYEARREIDAFQLENKDARKAGRDLARICDRHGVGKVAVLAYLAANKDVTAAVREWAATQNKKKLPKKAPQTDVAKKIWEIYGERYVREVLDAEVNERLTTYKALVCLNVDLKYFQQIILEDPRAKRGQAR